ncbi:AraC family transcriptional regulator [Luteibacter aegosomatissinici]|uniref:AraC family transcriptional regulator n=1 Tax=Luteibacter aegosomatissinici TaxID=2911539 RepID=UPI001FF8AE15|nr:AraC family transcriptional regulator [Luteibacter aegosomatissinici]UPG92445.1 AraC family transcriptional regulator [Luteibacter aegosomatissinici]
METILERMCEAVERHAAHARQETALPGLTLYRVNQAAHPSHVFYRPRMVVILRGSKTIAAGDAPFLADTSTFLLVTVDLPVCAQVFLDAEGRSHLAFSLDIDRDALAEAMARLPVDESVASAPAGVATARMTPELLEPFARLLDLLDHPADISFLAPLVIQEIYYRLFRSGLGEPLRQLALSGSHVAQIGRATQWIKANYTAPMSIEALADVAGMSTTSFHRHFKAITLMTPVQYRTRLRLQEARKMLLAEPRSAGAVAAHVGYDSQSQFTRDYKRMFGAPPAADAARTAGAP